MVENYLTDEMKSSGAALIQKMDAAGLQPDAAFWLYDSESQTWKLVIAEVKVGVTGPRKGYRQIQELLRQYSKQIQGVSLDDISLTTPNAPVVALLGRAIKTGPGISGIRFVNNVINGTLIEDAYIYRLS